MPDFYDIVGFNRQKSMRRLFWVSAIVVGLTSATLANAQVYRYEQGGSVTYGDSVPSGGVDAGHSVLNSRGVVLKQVRSREERVAQRVKDQAAKVVRIRDKTLLKTFTGEEDLIRTRDDRLGLLDGQIESLNDRVRISKESLVSIVQRISSAERSNGVGNASAGLYEEQEMTKQKISRTWTLIDSKAAERKEIATKFEGDLIRYRWLKNGGGATQ